MSLKTSKGVYNAESKSGKRLPLENIRRSAEAAVICAGRAVGVCATGEGSAEEEDAKRDCEFFVHDIISFIEVFEISG